MEASAKQGLPGARSVIVWGYHIDHVSSGLDDVSREAVSD